MEGREDLKAYLDGELSAQQLEKIRAAAEKDPEMQAELDALRSVGTALKSITRDYEVRGLEDTLSALTGTRIQPALAPKKRTPWLGYSLGLAAAAVIATVVTFPMFAQAKHSAKMQLVSSRVVSGDNNMKSMMKRPLGMQNALNMKSAAAASPIATPAPAAKVPGSPSLPEQLKSVQQQLNDLRKENERLKAHKTEDLAKGMDSSAFAAKSLPPLPMTPGEISMDGPGVKLGAGTDTFASPSGKSVAPAKVAQIEAKVKSLAIEAKAKVDSASGIPQLRMISITVETSKSIHLIQQIKSALGSSGSVVPENLPPPAEPDTNAVIRSRILDLRLAREKLLIQFLPEAPEVRELTDQITTLEASLKPVPMIPKTRLHITIG